jgi:hypothetical protein
VSADDFPFVKEHSFNTSWWGGPVGIVTQPQFFTLPCEIREQLLMAFDWVEYKSDGLIPEQNQLIGDCGFFHADTQLNYKVSLRKKFLHDPSGIEIQWANECPIEYTVDTIASFKSERFFSVRSVNQRMLDTRYVLWGNILERSNPGLCLQVLKNGHVQGWFFAEPIGNSKGIYLTLGMLSKHAVLRGMEFYNIFLDAYSSRGFEFGKAAFSVKNTPAHNIHCSLGVRFESPTDCWMWVNKRTNIY